MRVKRVGFFRDLPDGDPSEDSIALAIRRDGEPDENKIVDYLNSASMMVYASSVGTDIIPG